MPVSSESPGGSGLRQPVLLVLPQLTTQPEIPEMEMATLTSKGQLVIPKAIRAALHVRPGTRFSVRLR